MKLALILIIFLALYAAVSGITGKGSEAFRSPFFLVPLGLFALNLVSCTAYRLYREISGRQMWHVGPDLVHIALILMIISGLISLFGRWEGQVALSPGEAARLDETHVVVLEEFRIEHYENGAPKEWVSALVVSSKGGETKNAEVRVNHPARVGPYLIYQSSWQESERGAVSVLLAVKDPSSPLAFISIAFMVMGMGMTYVPKLRSLLEAS